MYCTRPPAVRGENKFACQHACKSVVRAALPRSRQRARLLVQARVSIAAPPKVSTAPTTCTTTQHPTHATSLLTTTQLRNAEQAILDAAAAVKGRGSNGITPQLAATMDDAIAVLEADRGVRAPTASGPLLDGRWRLIFTKPGVLTLQIYTQKPQCTCCPPFNALITPSSPSHHRHPIPHSARLYIGRRIQHLPGNPTR